MKTRKTMNSAKNVLEFFYLTVQLKELVRTGWRQWNVHMERLESVAEHIYGTCMLAIAVESEYNKGVDLQKVIMMLVVHELEEIVISDITPFQGVSAEEKLANGHRAIKEILSTLEKGYDYEKLILEFDAHITKESRFAYMCDKLEADLMSLYYDRYKDCTLENASEELKQNQAIIELSNNGQRTMGECFCLYEKVLDRLDEDFSEILEHAMKVYFDNMY